MREIKFRIWNPELDNGRMLYFDNFEEIVDWQNWDEWKLENSPMRSVDYMQYTGLKDKNGKEIYEGDVITNGRDDAVVVFDEGTFLAKIGKYCATESVYNFDYCTVFEVVGNIHENPELLEVLHETL